MTSTQTRRLLSLVALVITIAALAVPTAGAMTWPKENPPPPAASSPTLRTDDRLGPKYVPIPTATPAPAPTVSIVKPAGFDWGDALIGAAAAALTILTLAAGILALRARTEHRRLLTH